MTFKQKTALVALALLIAFAGAAQALPPKGGNGPGAHLKIEEVFVDFINGVLEISGQDLDFGPGPLEVTLAGNPLTVTSEGPNMIVATLPSVSDGDYLLVVSNGNGESQNDE